MVIASKWNSKRNELLFGGGRAQFFLSSTKGTCCANATFRFQRPHSGRKNNSDGHHPYPHLFCPNGRNQTLTHLLDFATHCMKQGQAGRVFTTNSSCYHNC